MEDKGRVRLPKLMNFRKNSKRPFTPPPHFRKIILLHFFPENPSLKHYINSHLPETNIEENTSMILPERLWVSISWMKESQTIYILSHIAQEKNLTRKDVLRLLMWGIRSNQAHKFDMIDSLGQATWILISTILKREIFSPTLANTWQLYQKAISTRILKSQIYFKLYWHSVECLTLSSFFRMYDFVDIHHSLSQCTAVYPRDASASRIIQETDFCWILYIHNKNIDELGNK